MSSLEALLPPLLEALGRQGSAILQAPTGTGKSTLVPLALLEADWLGSQRILMLEPRRLAARAVAARMATLLHEPLGGKVGFLTRLDSAHSRDTRLLVVTEGILTRLLQEDPALEGTGLVIFDEFHERSLQADLGLALTLDVRRHLRPDLRVLLMSATLAVEPLAGLLGGARIITGGTSLHPVETVYGRRPAMADLPRVVAASVRQALERHDGDVLVFLPGAGEIRRVEKLLTEAGGMPGTDVHPLYGDLSPAAQDSALAPAKPGRRKVILSTSIAETSLTIEGIGVVIDSGWSRRPRFDPGTAMSTLVTVRSSRAATDQRRGRAGRLGPGTCYRLWSEDEHRGLEAQSSPEILDADLCPLALELAAWGSGDAATLSFPDPPPPVLLAQSRELLTRLGALDSGGRITPHGRAMSRLGVHPRLAHMLLRAGEFGAAGLACDMAALLGERDLLRGAAAFDDADLEQRLALLRRDRGDVTGPHADRGALQRIRRQSAVLQRRLGNAKTLERPEDLAGVLLAMAYPDRIGQRRADGRFLLSGGRGAVFRRPQRLSACEFVVVAELDSGEREAQIFLAASISREQLEAHFSDLIESAEDIAWDDQAGAVLARRQIRLGALCLSESRIDSPDPSAIQRALIEGIRRRGPAALRFPAASQSLRERVEFLRQLPAGPAQDWPALDDTHLMDELEQWLGPWLEGVSRLAHLERVDLHAALVNRLGHTLVRQLESLAPTHLEVPSGSRLPIDYADPAGPALAVRLQEVFGMRETPQLAGGRVPLILKLLSPAQRPVQITRDLQGFWARGYEEVRKELKGRYPKHFWPDDPASAPATRRTRPR